MLSRGARRLLARLATGEVSVSAACSREAAELLRGQSIAFAGKTGFSSISTVSAQGAGTASTLPLSVRELVQVQSPWDLTAPFSLCPGVC